MRWSTLAAALFGGIVLSAAGANLRMSAAPTSKSPPKADADLAKLESIEHSMRALTKMAHAPDGAVDLLNTLSKAEGELKVAGSNKEARSEVMDHVHAAMNAFKAQMVSRSAQLKKDSANDEAKKVASLSSIAKKLQDRLDRLNKLEKDAQKRVKDHDEAQAKLEDMKLKRKQSKEDMKTDKMLKFFAKKNKRELKKKLISWQAERQALTDAIKYAKAGDAEGTKAAMGRVMHAEKGDKDFLY